MSPLVALMDNSVATINELMKTNVAVHVTASTVLAAKQATYLFASPEALLDGAGHDLLSERSFTESIAAVFIDECHLISAYSSSSGEPEFRATYTRLAELRTFLPEIPYVALTATATYQTVQDVASSLALRNPRLVKIGPNKTNIV